MMLVEVIYGVISNSLGLLTDGVHMFLDCSAIVVGIYSSYLSKRKPDNNYNYGYARSEVIGTFINSIFLVFIAFYIVIESVERFLQPKHIHSEHILFIAIIGLIVNLIGIVFLQEFHSDCHGHSHHHHHEKEDLDVETAIPTESIYSYNIRKTRI